MNRIIVIGCPGSGKSTFSKKLSSASGIEVHHLDNIFWNEDRTNIEISELNNEIGKILRTDRWIIDGNYLGSMEERIKYADTVFFLDYDTEICVRGILDRRGKKRDDLPFVEPADEVDEELMDMVKSFKTEIRPDVIDILERYNNRDIYIFKNRDEAERFLYNINSK